VTVLGKTAANVVSLYLSTAKSDPGLQAAQTTLQKSSTYSQLRRATDRQTDKQTDRRKCDLNTDVVSMQRRVCRKLYS